MGVDITFELIVIVRMQMVVLVPQRRLVTIVGWSFHTSLLDLLDEGVESVACLNVKFQALKDGDAAFELLCTERSVVVTGSSYLDKYTGSLFQDDMYALCMLASVILL